MQEHATRPLSVVLYAQDCERLARFYESVLEIARQEEQPDDFVLLASASIELAIVQAPPAIRDSISIASPPRVRSETPVKISFAVADVEAKRSAVQAAGGFLKPADAAWTWKGALHLDGWDPEGNVFQLYQPA